MGSCSNFPRPLFIAFIFGIISVLGLSVTKVDDGVMIKRGSTVKEKLVEWRVTFTLEDPTQGMRETIRSEIATLRTFLLALPDDIKFRKRVRLTYWIQELDKAQNVISNTRARRGLINFVGDLSQKLFGVATEKEVGEIMDYVRANRNSINSVINFSNDVLTVINVTKSEVVKNRQAINDIIRVTSQLKSVIQNITNWHINYHSMAQYDLIHEKVSFLWRHIHDFELSNQRHATLRYLLEQGRLGEQLLPKDILKGLATLEKFPNAQLISPLEWYYTNCRVFPIWNEDFLAFMVRIPFVSGTAYEGFEITTFPVPISGSNVTAQLKLLDFVALSSDGTVRPYYECVGQEPVVCNPIPVGKVDNEEERCARHVLLREEEIRKYCPVELRAVEGGIVRSTTPNHVIVITWGEVIREQCAGDSAAQTLGVGTFQVTWDGDCHLHTSAWTIAGVRTREMTEAVHHDWHPWGVDLNLTTAFKNLASTQVAQIPSLLSDPRTVRLGSLPTLGPVVTHSSPSNLYYFLFLLMCPILVCLIILVIYRRKFKRESIPPPKPARAEVSEPLRPLFNFTATNPTVAEEESKC